MSILNIDVYIAGRSSTQTHGLREMAVSSLAWHRDDRARRGLGLCCAARQ